MFGAWKTVQPVAEHTHVWSHAFKWMYNTSLKNVSRKRSYAPTLALTQVKWGQKVSIGAQPTFLGLDLRIMWTELKMDRSFSTKCLLRKCSSFFVYEKTVQLSVISLTSKPWMEARSLVHEELYNCLTLPWHQKPGWKPGLCCLEEDTTVWQYLDIKIPAFKLTFGAMKTEYLSKTLQLSARA